MKKPNAFFLALICVLVLVDMVILRPSRIETSEESAQGMFTSIEAQLDAQKKNEEIKYTIEGLHYTAIEEGRRQWEMRAREAVVYEKSNVAVASEVNLRMFDAGDKTTLIEGDRGIFRIGERELDLEGHLKATFPDQFWVKTEKAHYTSVDQRVTSLEPFYGESKPTAGESLRVWGTGFLGSRIGSEINVLSETRVQMRRPGDEEMIDVRSDQARIDRLAKTVHFFMKDKERFVESNRGPLYVRSRRQDATYDPSASVVKFLTAYDDVLIRETDEKRGIHGMKYATAQKAEFLAQKNKAILSGFPSVYQERDTVTGEVIMLHRDTSIVEVTEANAYHEGTGTDTKSRGEEPRQSLR